MGNTKKQDKKEKDIKTKVQIIYPNFKNKYTKQVYPLNEIIEVTDARLKEIHKLEADNNVKLISIIGKTENVDEETPKDGEENNNTPEGDTQAPEGENTPEGDETPEGEETPEDGEVNKENEGENDAE